MKNRNPLKRLVPVLVALFVVAVLATGLVSADTMAPPSIDTVLAEIRQAQNIGATDAIDASKVSPELLAELGDSVMETVIGDSAVHDRMDENLGGDGSASLDAYHARLALKYLSGAPVTLADLMGPAMMGGTTGGRGGMMGGITGGSRGGMMGGRGTYVTYDPTGVNRTGTSAMPWYGWAGMGFIVLLALGLLALLVVALVRGSRRAAATATTVANQSALDLLATRYAQGEIGDEEYRKKRDAILGR